MFAYRYKETKPLFNAGARVASGIGRLVLKNFEPGILRQELADNASDLKETPWLMVTALKKLNIETPSIMMRLGGLTSLFTTVFMFSSEGWKGSIKLAEETGMSFLLRTTIEKVHNSVGLPLVLACGLGSLILGKIWSDFNSMSNFDNSYLPSHRTLRERLRPMIDVGSNIIYLSRFRKN